MPSTNYYPARKQIQEYHCSAIATVMSDPDRQYSWVIFLDKAEEVLGYPYHIKMQFFYQSKFPPYVYRYTTDGGEERTVICGYVDGEDSMWINANWSYTYSNPSDLYVHDGYIRQCKLAVSDHGSRDTIGFYVLECYVDNGEDKIRVNSLYSDRVSIVSPGSHYGMVGRGEHIRLYKRTSGSFGNPTTPVLTPVRYPTAFRIASTQYYLTSSPFGSQDYRLIKWEPFQSGAEWLAYCQAHSNT